MKSTARIAAPRLSNWEAALAEYLAAKRAEPFAWAANDCCTFAAGAVIAMTGVDPIPEFRGRYATRIGAARALRTIADSDLRAVLDVKFEPVSLGQARRGDLAFAQDSVGVIVGPFAWFVAEAGLERIPLAQWKRAWRVGKGAPENG